MANRDRAKNPSRQGSTPAPQGDDVARFAALLRADDDRKAKSLEADRERARIERQVAADMKAAEQRAGEVQREHQESVLALKQARRTNRNIAEAELRWKRSSAAMLELETGIKPDWAPSDPVIEAVSVEPDSSLGDAGSSDTHDDQLDVVVSVAEGASDSGDA